MGGTEQKQAPPPPQKTVKEMVKEFSKSIKKLQREFQREVNKLEFNNKKVRMDLERMAKKKEPRVFKLEHYETHSTKYYQKQQLHSKIPKIGCLTVGCKLLVIHLIHMTNVFVQRLNQTATTETLVTVMTQMGTMMKQANQNVDVKNIHVALEQFNMEVEKQNIVGEQIQELMNDQDMDDNTDEDADKLINEVEQKLTGGNGGGGMQQQIEQPQSNFESIEDQLKNLQM